MLEVATAVRDENSLHTEELDITTSSHHSDDSSASEKAVSPSPVASERPASPNDYTPTDEVQTSGGDEGKLDLYALTREVLKLKKQNTKQAAQILKLKTKIKILWKKVKPGRKKVSDKSTAEVHEGTDKVHESTAGANLSTEPLMKEVEDEAGPSTFQDESDEFIQDDTLIADLLVNISKNRKGTGITIPGNIPKQERPKSPTLTLDPNDK
ncbi:hypothetical protein Tco_0614470, partial [Tanacetum coccineum]